MARAEFVGGAAYTRPVNGESGAPRAAWIGVVLVVLAAAVPALAIGLGALVGVRGEAADRLLQARDAGRPVPDRVVVLEVEGRTAFRYGQPPLPRSVYARAIRALDRVGAAAVGIDVQFTEPTRPKDDSAQAADAAAAEDLALLTSIEETKVPVVLVTTEVLPRTPGKPVDTGVLGGRVNLEPAGAVAAHASIPLAPDGVWRRAEPTVDGLPTFGAAIARAAGGPTVPAGGMLIDPSVPASRLHRYALRDLLGGRIPERALRGRAVLIGVTTTSSTGDDQGFVAGTRERVYGVQVQAQVVNTALAGAPLSAAPGLTWLLAALSAGLAALAAGRRRLLAQIGVVVGMAVLIPLVCWVAVRSGWLADPILPWLVLAFGGGAGIAQRAAEERRARALARATLGRFVPPAVVDELLRDGSDGRIPPHAEQATVMFCDLRGYTALTAGLSRPEALVDVLDAYLGTVSRVVYAHGGTVVSFQGDGVMTAFGVPVDDGRAAQHAVDAARELLDDALPALRTQLAETLGDGPAGAIALGIGIATGPVFAGTVGPETRREYAVVGPTTNLAARLQARTKEEAGPVLIDDATAAAVMGEERATAHTGVRTPGGPLVPVGPREIRGLPRAIDCWTLAS